MELQSNAIVKSQVAAGIGGNREASTLGRIRTQPSPSEEARDHAMTALDTGGAVAEYLDVVSIGGGARPYTIRQRHTDILQLFQASYERYQCSDKQEWAQGTSLVDPPSCHTGSVAPSFAFTTTKADPS